MVDVATVSSVMPTAKPGVVAQNIDTMFAALLQQASENGLNAELGTASATIPLAQTSVGTKTMALIQNPIATTIQANTVVANSNSATLPVASFSLEQPAPLDSPITVGTSRAAADSSAAESATPDTAALPTREMKQVVAMVNAKTTLTVPEFLASAAPLPGADLPGTDATRTDPAVGDTATTQAVAADDAITVPLDQVGADTSATDSITALAAASWIAPTPIPSQPAAQQTASPIEFGTPSANAQNTAPVAAVQPATASPDLHSAKATTQTSQPPSTIATTTKAPVKAAPSATTQQIGSDQAATDPASPLAGDTAVTSTSEPSSKTVTDDADSPAADPGAGQTLMAAAISADDIRNTRAAADDANIAAANSVAPTNTPVVTQAAAQAVAQTMTAAQTPVAAGRSDPKNKTTVPALERSASDKTSDSKLAASTVDEEHTEASPLATSLSVAANDSRPVQSDSVRAAPANPEKPAADASAILPSAPPLAPTTLSAVAAKIEVTTRKDDSDSATPFDKLGLTIAARSAEGLHHFDIRLDPAELGKVQVRLTVDDNGQAQATLVADKQQTLDLLQRDSASLNRALQDAGLNLSNNGLNFSLREQYQQNEAGGQGRRRSMSAAAVLATDASQSRSSQSSYAPNSVRLDIRV